MLGNQKNVFWEALLLAIIVFTLGMFLGLAFETNKVNTINKYYAQSELSLMDILALNNMVDLKDISCETLNKANIEFADKIYEEAISLEKYEASGKITENIKLAHHKYDVLRTFLWINGIKTLDKCKDSFSLIIYLYEYEPEDLTKKATQNIWSKVLYDLKEQKGHDILLIPIGKGKDLISLNTLADKWNISEFPVVIINEKHIIKEMTSSEELEKYLD